MQRKPPQWCTTHRLLSCNPAATTLSTVPPSTARSDGDTRTRLACATITIGLAGPAFAESGRLPI